VLSHCIKSLTCVQVNLSAAIASIQLFCLYLRIRLKW
jgi:hypothetical protein